jgi:hypothetical protein
VKLRSIHKELTLTPEFNGNRELATDEQITVEFSSLPTAIEADNYREFIFGTDGHVETIRYKDTEIMRRHVRKITNLADDDGAIDTGAKLAASKNPQVLPLVYEIREYLISQSEVIEPGES